MKKVELSIPSMQRVHCQTRVNGVKIEKIRVWKIIHFC